MTKDGSVPLAAEILAGGCVSTFNFLHTRYMKVQCAGLCGLRLLFNHRSGSRADSARVSQFFPR